MRAWGINRVVFSFLILLLFFKKKKVEIKCQCMKNNGIILDVLVVLDNTEHLFEPLFHVDKLRKIYAILDVLHSCHLDVRFGLSEYCPNSGFVPRLQFTRSVSEIFQNIMLYAKYFTSKYVEETEPFLSSSIFEYIWTEKHTFFEWRVSNSSNTAGVWTVSSTENYTKLIKLIVIITNAPCDINTSYLENASMYDTRANVVENDKSPMEFRFLLVGPYDLMVCWYNYMQKNKYIGNIVGVTLSKDDSIGKLLLLSPIITSILDVTDAEKYIQLQTSTLSIVILFLVIGYTVFFFFVLFFFN